MACVDMHWLFQFALLKRMYARDAGDVESAGDASLADARLGLPYVHLRTTLALRRRELGRRVERAGGPSTGPGVRPRITLALPPTHA